MRVCSLWLSPVIRQALTESIEKPPVNRRPDWPFDQSSTWPARFKDRPLIDSFEYDDSFNTAHRLGRHGDGFDFLAGQESHQVHRSIFSRNWFVAPVKTNFGQYGIDRSGQVSIVSANTKTGSATALSAFSTFLHLEHPQPPAVPHSAWLGQDLTGEQGRPLKTIH